MKLSETAQFRMGARTVYECNENSILDTCHHSYIVFGRCSAVKAVMLEPRCPVTAVAREAKCYSQQTQVLAGARRSLTCFKFRILRGPLYENSQNHERDNFIVLQDLKALVAMRTSFDGGGCVLSVMRSCCRTQGRMTPIREWPD